MTLLHGVSILEGGACILEGENCLDPFTLPKREASDVTLNRKTGYVVISLLCHPEDGDRLTRKSGLRFRTPFYIFLKISIKAKAWYRVLHEDKTA